MSQKKSISNTLVWILMGLLILSLGGFGITNLGGTVNTVGTVNGKDIGLSDYARALDQDMRAFEAQTGQRINFAQAQMLGLDQQVLGGLVTRRALDAEAQRLGLSIGDERLRDELFNIPAFQGLNGEFDREAYAFTLESAGLNEADFEIALREDAARTLLQQSIAAGITMPTIYSDTLLAYIGESRDFSVAVVDESILSEPIGSPDEAKLRSYYDANVESFMRPATRDITYAWLTPDMLLDTVEVDEATLRALYDERADIYLVPERRLVERLVLSDETEAAEAVAEIAAGTVLFDDLVEARGLALADVDLGDVSKADLGTAGDMVFAAASGQVVGPAETDLGPAIFRINGILNAQETSFEQALPELRAELAADRARRVIDAQINDIDDLLAGGATLEEVVQETDMALGTIQWHANLADDIAGYEAFRAQAAIATESDFPQIEQLEDGGIFALRLDGETAAAPAPFDDITEEVAAAWRAEELLKALQSHADTLVKELENGAHVISLGVTVLHEQDIARGDFIPDMPPAVIEAVFELDVAAVRTVSDTNRVLVVQLKDVNETDLSTAENESLRGILSQQINQELAQQVLEAYSNQIRLGADIDLNQQALNAVHAQMP